MAEPLVSVAVGRPYCFHCSEDRCSANVPSLLDVGYCGFSANAKKGSSEDHLQRDSLLKTRFRDRIRRPPPSSGFCEVYKAGRW